MKNFKFINALRMAVLGAALFLSACATRPLIVLDSGHNPVRSSGAISVRGINEVDYNDIFTGELERAFAQAGWQVVMTRKPEEDRSLDERAAIANETAPLVFLSIHHDSTQLENLAEIKTAYQPAYRTKHPIAGSSLHISIDNPHYDDSLRFATLVGEELQAVGRKFNLDHANPSYERPLPLVNADYAIYRHDLLRVLRTTTVPAVLLEVGVIVDIDDEELARNADERQKLISAIVKAADKYRKQTKASWRKK
ncbi:hypothetical protein B0181_02715 [Moraxella caviae]|uniref:N-acetylmuramoyl-L-alanine amidase n=1 Tax=Moraxella caviae TaxID=34060 RepID=A0A1T0A7G9_9GAMM|nr:N-acetylmuramoyl-L-alanine amidase [Moraxella caviae]OOR91674.1 hypothetical protein B0181_02715 [Moraxella caviae]STZ10407.1 N-acetylmuramoyl-l-alanine amidase I [Moraxella caviae]